MRVYPELTEFCTELRQLRVMSGSPKLWEIAERGHVSESRLSIAVAGKTVPTWAVVAAWIKGCGHEPDGKWKHRYATMRAAVERRRLGAGAPRDPHTADDDLVSELAARDLEVLDGQMPPPKVAIDGQSSTGILTALQPVQRALQDVQDQLVIELKYLRRGRGLFASDLTSRVGPVLAGRCGIDDLTSQAEARARLINRLDIEVSNLPAGIQLALRAALALPGADQSLPGADQSRFLRERMSWLSYQLDRDLRTATRRVDEGLPLLAERLLQTPADGL